MFSMILCAGKHRVSLTHQFVGVPGSKCYSPLLFLSLPLSHISVFMPLSSLSISLPFSPPLCDSSRPEVMLDTLRRVDRAERRTAVCLFCSHISLSAVSAAGNYRADRQTLIMSSELGLAHKLTHSHTDTVGYLYRSQVHCSVASQSVYE